MNATAEYVSNVIIWNLMWLCLKIKNNCLDLYSAFLGTHKALYIEHILHSHHCVSEVHLSPKWLSEFITHICRSLFFIHRLR